MELRSRWLIDHKKQIFVITNYKCGFSFLNHKSIPLDKSIQSPAEMREAAQTYHNYKKYLIVRDPVARFLSFYYNWMVDKDPGFVDNHGKLNHATSLLKEYTPVVQDFISATAEQRASIRFIELFSSYLPDFYMGNQHTVPQRNIYTKCGLSISWFTDVIPIESLSDFIQSNYGVSAPITNQSSRPDTAASERVIDICRNVYRDDYEDFGPFIK